MSLLLASLLNSAPLQSVCDDKEDDESMLIRRTPSSSTIISDIAARAEHAAECKGLMLQIRYLKAKLVREADLRADLAHQKGYLEQLVGGLELNQAATRRFVADIQRSRGLKSPPATPLTPKQRFKKSAQAVLAVVRMGQMAARWKETCQVKVVLRRAHLDARQRRANRLPDTGKWPAK